jgi:hypothetical protein
MHREVLGNNAHYFACNDVKTFRMLLTNAMHHRLEHKMTDFHPPAWTTAYSHFIDTIARALGKQ